MLLASTTLALAGCGDDDTEPPVTVITGKVRDATTQAPIAGARVVALDGDTAAAVSTVSLTDAEGSYHVDIPTMNTTATRFTLRVAAERYQDFPSPVRIAIPIEVAAGATGVRDVTLLPIAGADAAQLGSLAGTVRQGADAVAGVLVVAEGAGKARSAVTDSAGSFVILNLPAASYDVRGYFGGMSFAPLTGVALAANEDKAGLALVAGSDGLSRLTGGINIVNPQTTTAETLIVLALASTREVPPGLAKMTSGKSFDIAGIPPGSYDILASFNNDDLVLDPDPSQLPRPIRINLPADAPGGTLAVGSFKVTGDVGIMSPGSGAPGEAPVAAAGLMLRWEDDSSEDFYGLEVLDAFGERIWGNAPSFTVEPAVKSDKNTSSIAYAGPALLPGQTYQWRVTSYQCKVSSTPCTMMEAIASSENLRGVFEIARTP